MKAVHILQSTVVLILVFMPDRTVLNEQPSSVGYLTFYSAVILLISTWLVSKYGTNFTSEKAILWLNAICLFGICRQLYDPDIINSLDAMTILVYAVSLFSIGLFFSLPERAYFRILGIQRYTD